MLILLLILFPLLGGILIWLLSDKLASIASLIVSVVVMVLSLVVYNQYHHGLHEELIYQQPWISQLGATFSLEISNGLPLLMVMLTGFVFPLIIGAWYNKPIEKASRFYGLMFMAQAGLMGVFLAKDALLFYVFWEVALIPVYFLSSMYGGARRIPVTFKFFVYTFLGSLLMLVAFLYIYQQTPIHSFSWDSLVSTGKSISPANQQWLFWMLFIAFAIKMPVFPFHTWQPDAYEQSATPVTIVLSAIMVKMGLFAVVRWLLPVLPDGVKYWMDVVMWLSVAGIVYASCMAMVQTNIKRLIAYSSIAHIGLMAACLFAHNADYLSVQGAAVQMFNHGINIAGMWIIVGILEHRLGTQQLDEMGGVAKIAPYFTVGLVLISLANIALPLTNGFIGEFMMFNGLFNADSKYRVWLTVLAGLGVILSAVYTLTMVQKVAYGPLKTTSMGFNDLEWNEKIVVILILLVILILGFYPKYLLDLVNI
jgi:NADH-quinone oxidoreductase subunit M